jgi:hypothetical protein
MEAQLGSVVNSEWNKNYSKTCINRQIFTHIGRTAIVREMHALNCKLEPAKVWTLHNTMSEPLLKILKPVKSFCSWVLYGFLQFSKVLD